MIPIGLVFSIYDLGLASPLDGSLIDAMMVMEDLFVWLI
jgi:hypothetical protein